MEPWTFPPALRSLRFTVELESGAPIVDGLGRASFRIYESRERLMVDIRCGRVNLTARVPNRDHWRQLGALLGEHRVWFAGLEPLGNDSLNVEIFNVADFVDLGSTTIALPEDASEDSEELIASLSDALVRVDNWSNEKLLLIRCDVSTSQMFVCGNDVEALLSISEDAIEISRPTIRQSPGDMTKWLIVSHPDVPFSRDPDTDPLVIARISGHIAGLGDFLSAWRTYSDAEENFLIDLQNELGEVRFGKVREKKVGDAGGMITVGVNPREPAGAQFLGRLALRVSDGQAVNLELSERAREAETRSDRSSARIMIGRAARCIGRVTAVDVNTGDVELVVDSTAGLVPDGWISVSITGDLRQIERRREALRRLQSDQAGISSLRSVLAGAGGGLVTPPKQLRSAFPESVTKAGLTPRQMAAVRIALTTPDVALIQGPPGTGKTKVITAIEEALAHLEGPGRSTHLVLLTSTQNDAVDQVASRTRVFGLPPYRDGRGNVDPIGDWRRERLFAAHQLLTADAAHTTGSELAAAYVRIRDTPVTAQELARALDRLAAQSLGDDISQAARTSADLLRRRGLKSSTRQKLERRIRALRVTEESFFDDGPARLADLSRMMDDRQLPEIWRSRFAERLEQALSDGAGAWRSLAALRDDLLDLLAAEIDDRPAQATKEIIDLFAEAVGRAKRLTKSDRTAELTVGEAMERYIEDIEQHPAEADTAIRDYTVVHAATCQRSSQYLTSLRWGSEPTLFENTVVDEAGRVNPLDLIIPLVQARKRVILVGDHRQLPAVYDESIARGLPQAELLEQSLFERLFQQLRAVGERTGVQRAITLDQQFRMHPRLGEFVSSVFYEPHGEAISSPLPEKNFTHNFPGFEGRTAAWIDVPHHDGPARRSERKSWSRRPEAEVVAEIVRDFVTECPTMSVGVITFYGDQRDLIMEMLLGDLTQVDQQGSINVHPDFRDFRAEDGSIRERLRIGTVDAFQGKEFDAVILSMVRSESPASTRPPGSIFGFLAVENRFCVALSRQRRLLVVVGDKSMADLPQAESIRGLRELRELCVADEVPVG
jgi:AAA domain